MDAHARLTHGDAGSAAVRRGIVLAVIYLLVGAIALAYALTPPTDTTPRGLDAGLVLASLVLAVASYLIAPRGGRLGTEILLAIGWLGIVVMAATRPTVAGQVLVGILLLVTALYAAYYLPTRPFVLQLAGMTLAYGAVRFASSLPGDRYFFGAVLIVVIIIVSCLVHRLRLNDLRYRLLAGSSADVLLQARRGVIEWVSPSVERVLGWQPSELVGKPTLHLWHPDDRGRLNHDATVVSPPTGTRSGRGSIIRLLHKDGDYVWIDYTVKPRESDEVDGSVAVLRDVTARIVAEEEIQRRDEKARDEAERAVEQAEAKANLFQNISHELRTPLAIISGPLHDMRQRHDLTPEERDGLDAALRASTRLARLVDGLLDIAAGESDRLGPVSEPTDLVLLTRGGTEMFADVATSAGIELMWESESVPECVMTDPDAWMTILVNLVSNAVKYTQQGAVRVQLRYHDGVAHLIVSDTGVGISEAELPHVFERYHRAGARAAHGEAGSGIGLAVVAQLLRELGGGSGITSVEGVGTTVEAWLPAPACTGQSAKDVRQMLGAAERQYAWAITPARGTGPVGSTRPEGESRGNILVVEDNDDLRAYLVRLLARDHWSVTDVADAESAASLVASHDLVLSDIMLPGASGVDLVRWIRERDDDARYMPVLLLTARADDDAVVTGLSAGADDYVTKPFSPSELLARIGTHAELACLRQVVLDQATGRAANLEKALGSNRMIGTALGIIMATEHVSAEVAFDRLKSASQHANRKLRDVADDVIFSGALPEDSVSYR